MLGLFLSQTPGLLVEMKEAIDQHDLVQLSKLGHKMKSMISTLGISEVKDDMRILEKAGSLNATPAQIEQSFRKLETILGIVFRQLSVEISNY
jgi:HPt (histidine-containing phosphotransfer) domain-containing protein